MKYKQNYNKDCENYPEEYSLHAETTIKNDTSNNNNESKQTMAWLTFSFHRCGWTPTVSSASTYFVPGCKLLCPLQSPLASGHKSSTLIVVHVSWEAEVELKVETDVWNRIDGYRSEIRSKLLKRTLISVGRYHTCTKFWGKPFTKRQNGSQNPNDDKWLNKIYLSGYD